VVGMLKMGKKLRNGKKTYPDVIMTDIKNAFMDGLELGKRITDIMPSNKIIIFLDQMI
jgi:two-component system response regulator YesN